MKHLYFHPGKGVVLVTQGFCWPAAIFGSLWAMAHRMWFPHLLALLPIEGMLWFMTSRLQALPNDEMLPVLVIANLALFLVRGLYGDAWLAASLRRRGYTERRDLLPAATTRPDRRKQPVTG